MAEHDMNGMMWPNEYKKKEDHPDWKGVATVHGREVRMTMWYQVKDGKERFSVRFEEPQAKGDGGGSGGGGAGGGRRGPVGDETGEIGGGAATEAEDEGYPF